MKTLIKIPLVFVLILLSSCSKDIEIEDQTFSGELEGIWKVEIYEYDGTTRSIFQNDVWDTQFYGFGWNIDLTMVFTKNPNNFTLTGTNFVDHFLTNRYGIENLYFGNLVDDQAGDWSRANHLIELKIDGVQKRSFISELTDSRLIITINTNVSETDSDDTITTIQKREIYTLKRINN